ncbi:hypothetical protein NESM_000385600 [Novymonas esmeraldas]|uniref:Telomere length regulation protein n=1 Tax=Novymonas esmeraldas TaxID=1808958 RepID=A0AAW0EN10_9TRYP
MADFATIERKVLHQLRAHTSGVSALSGRVDDRAADALASLSAELKLGEPVTLLVQEDPQGVRHYTCSSPAGEHVLALAAGMDGSASAVEKQLVEHQCQQLVSFPERLANVVAEQQNRTFSFDATLFWERLCDTALLLFFSKPQRAEECRGIQLNPRHLTAVSKVLTAALLRRGKTETIIRRMGLLPRDLFAGEQFNECFASVVDAVFEASKLSRFSLKSRSRAEVSAQWQQWNSLLLALVVKRTDIKGAILGALCSLMTAPPGESASQLANSLFHALVVNHLCSAGSTRATARTIFKELLPGVAGTNCGEGVLSAQEQECLHALFHKWGDKDFVTAGDLHQNLLLLHPVMYALLYLHSKKSAKSDVPGGLVGPILSGVTHRLDSTRGPELRSCAMTVAAAYASLFVTSAEGVAPLLQDANFSAALNGWMKEEPGAAEHADHTSATAHLSAAPAASSSSQQRASSLAEAFPLDPDEAYHFFTQKSKPKNERAVATGAADLPAAVWHSASQEAPLPLFGQQAHAKDELDENVSILGSIRACYNALIGVGRGPNAQLHEVQEASESGLRGLADAFDKLRRQIGSETFRAVGKETGPLIAVLLPTLISLSIHAPEEKKHQLMQMRYSILVNLIVVNPVLALSQLGGMVYRSSYGIYQRTELIKAIGEAATVLSLVEAPSEAAGVATATNSGHAKDAPTPKRIYPPIPTHEPSRGQKTAIVVNEGQRTRRWGNAIADRQTRARPKRYMNLLGEVAAAFVAVFLHKLDADHFAFFQDDDPYTPCAILDSITAVFQGITNVRHVAPELCEKNYDFFFTVCTRHPNLSVRKAAWAAIVEVMRAWCGVAPLWIRRNDGERILNRDAAAYGSIAFTTTWLSALDALQNTCAELVRKEDPCGRTAVIAVSTLRDLVCDRDDFHSMLARVEEQVLGD